MAHEASDPRELARVLAVEPDDLRYLLELRDGRVIAVVSSDELELSEGDVVLHSPHGHPPLRVSSGLWPSRNSIGNVRLVRDDALVLELNGVLRLVDPPLEDMDLAEGNSVEYSDTHGIVRKLTEQPLQRLDLGLGDKDVEDFRVSADQLSVTFDDFGGQSAAKDRARELVDVSLKAREALDAIGSRPVKGVLFTGPPGTGKTLLARILANESGAEFFQVGGPAIISAWVGSSEGLLRDLFETAEREHPAIIFFDEIDSLAPRRSDYSHESSKRLVAQLLTEMDGFTGNGVVVVGATNRIEDLDPALLRPGRFDWKIEFQLPDEEARQAILEASSRELNARSALPVIKLASVTEGWSGAELAAIWTEAALLAAGDDRRRLLSSDVWGAYDRIRLGRLRDRSWVGNA